MSADHWDEPWKPKRNRWLHTPMKKALTPAEGLIFTATVAACGTFFGAYEFAVSHDYGFGTLATYWFAILACCAAGLMGLHWAGKGKKALA